MCQEGRKQKECRLREGRGKDGFVKQGVDDGANVGQELFFFNESITDVPHLPPFPRSTQLLSHPRPSLGKIFNHRDLNIYSYILELGNRNGSSNCLCVFV